MVLDATRCQLPKNKKRTAKKMARTAQVQFWPVFALAIKIKNTEDFLGIFTGGEKGI